MLSSADCSTEGSESTLHGAIRTDTERKVAMIVHYRENKESPVQILEFNHWQDALQWARDHSNYELTLPDNCHICADPMNKHAGYIPHCEACELETP